MYSISGGATLISNHASFLQFGLTQSDVIFMYRRTRIDNKLLVSSENNGNDCKTARAGVRRK